VKYSLNHQFDVDGKTLLKTMFSKDIVSTLKPLMKTIIEAETLQWEENGDCVLRRIRYLPVPKIKSVGPKKVNPKWMEWVEESEVDLEKLVVRYRNIPTNHKVAELLKNSGEMHVVPSGNGCVREIRGELLVRVFLLGSIAERLIYSYAKEILEEEANAMKELLERQRR
jgi:carbon monoxide dehydrogenase subunit G